MKDDNQSDEQLSATDRLIDRALTGDATADELSRIDDPELLEGLQREFARHADPRATDAAWARLSSMIAARESRPIERVLVAPPPRHWSRRWAMAAAIVAIIVGALTTTPFATRARFTRANPETVIASERGQSRTINLADGSTVVLDAGSRIRVPRSFGRRARDISLEGTAYFVVKHDAAMPFRVHVRDGVIEDVGTRFVVEAYDELRHATVSVAEGSVALQSADVRSAPVPLVAGDVGELAEAGAVRVAQHVDVDSRVAWMRGELVFDDTPLADALPRLSRWYDRDVRLADSSLATRRLTARFRADQPPDVVFGGVALALGARASQQGRVVTLTVAP